MVIFHSYVNLPEGKSSGNMMKYVEMSKKDQKGTIPKHPIGPAFASFYTKCPELVIWVKHPMWTKTCLGNKRWRKAEIDAGSNVFSRGQHLRWLQKILLMMAVPQTRIPRKAARLVEFKTETHVWLELRRVYFWPCYRYFSKATRTSLLHCCLHRQNVDITGHRFCYLAQGGCDWKWWKGMSKGMSRSRRPTSATGAAAGCQLTSDHHDGWVASASRWIHRFTLLNMLV